MDCLFLRRGMQKKKTVTATFNPSSYTVQSSSSDSVVTNASNMYKPWVVSLHRGENLTETAVFFKI